MSNIEEPNVLQLSASSAAMHPLQQLATNTCKRRTSSCTKNSRHKHVSIKTKQHVQGGNKSIFIAGYFKLASTKHVSQIPSVMDDDAIIITNQLSF
jgi:hypothetical protein